VLNTYQEIRDRIYTLARERGLRVDWAETTPLVRLLLLYDHCQVAGVSAEVWQAYRELRARLDEAGLSEDDRAELLLSA
jgi:hypothetical protein